MKKSFQRRSEGKRETVKNNKPKEKIRVGRISLVKWENTNQQGEVFKTYSLSKTLIKRSDDDLSKFEGRVFTIHGLTKTDLESINQAVSEMYDKDVEGGW